MFVYFTKVGGKKGREKGDEKVGSISLEIQMIESFIW